MPALDVALACRGPGGSRLDPGALASLDLRGKGVNAVAPSLGSHLTGLAKLDLADNVLGNDCVGALASLVTLKHLSVANNSLNGDALRPWLGAASAADPPGKKRRALQATSAPKAPSRRRGKHSQQHFKKIQDNTSGDAYSSTHHGVVFPEMRVLNVSGNGLVSVSGVAAARNLGALIANENKITSLRHVDALRDLNTLVASSNDIDEIGDEFSKLINLNKLSLSHNKLKTVGDALAQCAALRELRLARNEITALPKRALAGCARLRVLDLSGNAFKDFGDVEALKFLPKLQQLSMRGSPLSRNAKGYDAIVTKMCPSLKTLDGRRVGPGGWLETCRLNTHTKRVGPGGWLDAPSENDLKKKPAPRPDADADLWADARAAAGLDPLEASERPAGAEETEKLQDESGSAYDDDDDDGDDDGDSDDDDSDDSDDDSDDSEEMDDEEREMMAEVRALRASMRAEEHAKKGGERREAKRGRDDEADGVRLDPGDLSKELQNPGRVSAAPGAEGTSFLQELVARNVGSVRGTLGVGGEDPLEKTDGEKLAAATRSGVVKIVEVKKKKRRDGDETSRKQNVVATGRDALLALLGDGAEAAGDGAWGGGGWGLEEEEADAEEDEERRRKKTKTREDSLDDAGARDVGTLLFSSEKKKKKRRETLDDFDDFDARLGASAKKKKREDDPWNDDESKRRRKQAMLSKKKKKQNVLARRYKK